ncbi:MAG: right-handed parallel beta-helix repeat-containing protein, partial [Chitinophagales bacterium]|nr:right-handed parallel beta-helix repeat-containing protein [Chitinophagales bacterium]
MATTVSSNTIPLGANANNKCQWIYKPGAFKDAGGTPVGGGNNITKVYFRFAAVNATSVYDNFTISLGQNGGVDSVYTAGSTTFDTALTVCYYQVSQQFTGIALNAWYGFTLTTPFTYDPTKSLIIEIKRTNAVGANSVGHISVAPGNAGSRRRWGANAATVGSIGTGHLHAAIDVIPNAACTAPPTAGTNNISPLTGLCSGGNLSLNLTGNSTGSGQTYVWKRSSTLAGTYTVISGVLTSPAFNYNPSDSGFYRCTVFCSGDSSTTAATKVNVVAPFPAGTYTINSAVATGGTNYQTFAAAVNALACGIAGPIVFNVVPGSGPYNEQISIPSLIGSSSTNTVTFNGNGTTITSAGGVSYATFDLNGADYIRVKNLNIVASNATLGFGVHLWNGADNNIFDSCNVNVNTTATGSTCIGVSMSGSTTSYSTQGANGKNNLFSNCNVTGGYIGFSFYGESAGITNNANNSIRNCRITDYYFYGVYNIYQGNNFISNNIIERPTRTTSTSTYGVMLTTGCLNVTVERNRIRNLFTSFPTSASTCYPLYCALTTATAGNENKFINNIISDIVHAGPIYAIYVSTGSYLQVYNNTIVLNDASATTASATYGIYSTSTTALGLDFRNNSIHISRGGAGTKACLYYRSAFITSDNNNLFMASTAGTNNIGDNTTLYASLATWQTANGGAWDANSVSANPQYSNAAVYNYIPTTTALNNAADSIPSFVSIDIDSVVRSVTPDIGAHEFTVGTLDAKIDWVSPLGSQTAGNKNVRAKITNMSVDPITSLIANYTDGTTVYTDTFTCLALLTGDTAILNFTNLYNL